MKIVLIHKAQFYKRPPVINSTLILSDLGHDVTLITEGLNTYWEEELKRRNIKVCVIQNRFIKYGTLGKVLAYRNFKQEAFKIIEQEKKEHSSVLVWVEGAYTIVALGKKLNEYKHILQIQELHEESKMQLNAISKVINSAEAVFMPEYNRAAIYRVWFKLDKMPYLLPNKPDIVCKKEDMQLLTEKYRKQLEQLEGKKVIIYQGFLGKDRDLAPFVQAVKELGGDFRLAVMGEYRQSIDLYKKIDPQLIHIDYTPAPEHLAYTAKCYIGILSYNPHILNNAFCAPNKIFEYAKFKIPVLCNELPGLKWLLDSNKAGLAIDITNVKDIKKAIIEIDNNYEEYSKNAERLYNSVNNKETIHNVLIRIEDSSIL